MLGSSFFLCFFGRDAVFGWLPEAVPSRTRAAGDSPASSCFLCPSGSEAGDFGFSAPAVAGFELLLADSCSLLDARLEAPFRFLFCVLSRGLVSLDRPLVLRSRRLCLSALRLLLRRVSLLLDRRFLPESLLRLRGGSLCLRLLADAGPGLRDMPFPPLVSCAAEQAGRESGGRSAWGLSPGACGGKSAPPYAAKTALGFWKGGSCNFCRPSLRSRLVSASSTCSGLSSSALRASGTLGDSRINPSPAPRDDPACHPGSSNHSNL